VTRQREAKRTAKRMLGIHRQPGLTPLAVSLHTHTGLSIYIWVTL
jgi:hypothetical protein